MSNLAEFKAPLPKPGFDANFDQLQCVDFKADTAEIDDIVIDNLEVKVLTLVNQASVPNPAVGSISLFTANADQVLTSTNPAGVSVKYLQNPSGADQDMSNHEVKGIKALRPNSTSVIFGTTPTTAVTTAIGYQALESQTVPTSNTAVGYRALASVTTGIQSTAVGRQALELSTGDVNTAVGYRALALTTSGSQNSAFGNECLRDNTTGGSNVGIGNICLQANTTGAQNVGVGRGCLQANTTGSTNVGAGFSALAANTTGSGNVGVGTGCLSSNTTGSNNTCVGNGAGDSTVANDSTVSIGHNARANASKARVLSSGSSCVNAVADSWLIGDSSVANIRPDNDGVCDLGATANKFGSVYANGVRLAQGANLFIGTATLVAGTVTVATTRVTTNSKVFVSRNTPGGTLGRLSAPAASIVNATSFVINSDSALETSTVNWWIVPEA